MQKIAIFVSCHKPCAVYTNNYIKAIQVGAELSNELIPDMLHDNVGDNISSKNKRYCELTAQYWAWKNVDADYYGFFHYRRYLNFGKKLPKKPLFDAKVTTIDNNTATIMALDEQSIANIVTKYDVILPKRSFRANVYLHYKYAPSHHIRDLKFCLKIIKRDYPYMYKAVKKYMRSPWEYICNMFVMKKTVFNHYCKWLFDILNKHEQQFACKDYPTKDYRVSGFLAERLFGIYATWLKQTKNYKIKHIQRVKIVGTANK